MDHLMRVQDGKKHPPKHDLLNLHVDSILDCKIAGEWNVFNVRSITFSLRHHILIDFFDLVLVLQCSLFLYFSHFCNH